MFHIYISTLYYHFVKKRKESKKEKEKCKYRNTYGEDNTNKRRNNYRKGHSEAFSKCSEAFNLKNKKNVKQETEQDAFPGSI